MSGKSDKIELIALFRGVEIHNSNRLCLSVHKSEMTKS